MKILIPISAFERSGGFRVLSELATHWVNRGHKVDFLVDIRSGSPMFPTRANILRFNHTGQVEKGDGAEIKSKFPLSGNLFSVWTGMWRSLNKIASTYDVILANHSLTTYPIAFACAGKARKWYYVQAYEPEYYSFYSGIRGKVFQLLSALSYSLPLKQIANAPIYINYRSIRAQNWIPPGLDVHLFYRRDMPPTFASGKPLVIGTIGRTEPTKGTVDVLAAFELVAALNPCMHLSVAFGNLPPEWSHPRATVVVPHGDAELAAWYRSIDILIAPGTVQLGACHYPVIEAMASGTPVITTGYLPADVHNAWIVPVHSPPAIAEAILAIASFPIDQLKEKLDIAALATKRFEWLHVADEFITKFG
jgi:glycosyltransferase involved in cell wall biosynthesis